MWIRVCARLCMKKRWCHTPTVSYAHITSYICADALVGTYSSATFCCFQLTFWIYFIWLASSGINTDLIKHIQNVNPLNYLFSFVWLLFYTLSNLFVRKANSFTDKLKINKWGNDAVCPIGSVACDYFNSAFIWLHAIETMMSLSAGHTALLIKSFFISFHNIP